ncbi:ROK family protein [Thalassovita sp.]|uniref:glucokinase n=1 Tax=Thalassovita sp. TaxID=1979401 RepID=UPI0029DE7BB0|nr:ROK family protein [Thalassovita sp.]
MQSLVGDFGGTNCRLALVGPGGSGLHSLRSYRNADFPSPEAVLRHFLDDVRADRVNAACLGVAGPVRGGAVRLTNYPWRVSALTVTESTGAGRVWLLNDLQAHGYALHGLDGAGLLSLAPGRPSPQDAPRLVVAIGTGVNAAVAHRIGGAVFVPPSESGHMGLSALDQVDLDFAASVMREQGHCPTEAALSGNGLARLWRMFGGPEEQDGTAVTRAFRGGDLTAEAALRRAALYLGRYCADLALVHLPFGGLFLAGSVGLALAPHLVRLGFLTAFHRAGPYADLLATIPVYAVPDMPLCLDGCARFLAQELV